MSESIHHYPPLILALHHLKEWPYPVSSVEIVETHISYVLLAGQYAYKIKKPLDLGFLNFTTLESRKQCCEEELRLNLRLASNYYLSVVPICGEPENPVVGGEGKAIEYAVKMRRFPEDCLLSRRPELLNDSLIERIATRIASFHQTIAVCGKEENYGSPERIAQTIEESFDQITQLVHTPQTLGVLKDLNSWFERTLGKLQPVLQERRRSGFIRECHGDMHLGNITLADGEAVIFDALEFNPDLRWIDTMSEIAFLSMDLEEKGRPGLARFFLNCYLSQSGDYAGLAVLPLYQAYRALVRAKVSAIRIEQGDLEPKEREGLQQELRAYLELAGRYFVQTTPVVMITHGPSGAGKSTAAKSLMKEYPLIWLRSDVERKRLAGLSPQQNSHGTIYSKEMTQCTYKRLLELAECAITARFSPLVDATFLKHQQRQLFFSLAERYQVRCLILDFLQPTEVLVQRIQQRSLSGGDPSEADQEILRKQLAGAEHLTDHERVYSIQITEQHPLTAQRVVDALKAQTL